MKNILIDISGKIENAYVDPIKEMRMMCTNKTNKYLRKILNDETSDDSNYNLIRDMSLASKIDFERILFLLRKLKKDFTIKK
ncbi:MAG: hypothetical protein FJW69_03230 [Actinobacteria bacterium]|nr:hypothetical protein [Actinomycetota bacterium]MBM3713356.1 hypothetical protein [Actinomycetota bacterium]